MRAFLSRRPLWLLLAAGLLCVSTLNAQVAGRINDCVRDPSGANGGRGEDNNFTFNGANFTHFAQSTGVNYPPPDAIQEIRILTHSFSSEYGNSAGSQVSVTSKAGSNSFHGSAWEFLRNTMFNARSFFQPRRPANRQNQAGAALGGPIKKDKLCFFGYYQKLWNRPESGSTVALVPTAA